MREHFLLPWLLLNELVLMIDVLRERPITRITGQLGPPRNPVCGMAVEEQTSAVTAINREQEHVFCSETCCARFMENPGRFLAAWLGPPG